MTQGTGGREMVRLRLRSKDTEMSIEAERHVMGPSVFFLLKISSGQTARLFFLASSLHLFLESLFIFMNFFLIQYLSTIIIAVWWSVTHVFFLTRFHRFACKL